MKYLIFLAAMQADVPPELLSAICFVESSHRPHVVNTREPNGRHSIGLCQIQYRTAEWVGYKGDKDGLLDAYTNAYYSGKYLNYQLGRYKGDIVKAVSAYNAGRAIPNANSKYVNKVLRRYYGNCN